MFAKPMKINPSTIAGALVATMVVGFLCGLLYVVNYLLSQR
jgi:ABC-type antimicrobial peptide transport system permease subunit